MEEQRRDVYSIQRGERIKEGEWGLDYVAVRARFDGLEPTVTEGQLLLEGEQISVLPGTPARFVLDANSTHRVVLRGPEDICPLI